MKKISRAARRPNPYLVHLPKIAAWSAGGLATLGALVVLLPLFVFWSDEYAPPTISPPKPFTVTVNPATKTIIEDPAIEAELSRPPGQAAARGAMDAVEKIAYDVASMPAYKLLASAVVPEFVTVEPGFRKEEVADAFGEVLSWSAEEKKSFTSLRAASDPGIPEGTFAPGLYLVSASTTEAEAEELARERFERIILSRYSTSTREAVPLDTALTVASLIQRETGDREEMRMISGIIWNRIFSDMRLQIDATLQYAKVNAKKGKITDWWPIVAPRDKYISSPYNTYLNEGLPPSPIASPGVAAVIAALNPKKTTCLFYFHDKNGEFHCTDTYEEHVKLLKKYFGQGK